MSAITSRRNAIRLALIGLPALTACNLPLPGAGPPPRLFSLTPKSTFSEHLPRVSAQLLVEEPVAASGLNTARIMLRPDPFEIEYFASVAWAERAPNMIQTLLVESFENSGGIVSVGRESSGLRADYILRTELREFQAEYFDRPKTAAPDVRVRVSGSLVTLPERHIADRYEKEHLVTAKSSRVADVIAAFDEGLGKVMAEIVKRTLVVMHA